MILFKSNVCRKKILDFEKYFSRSFFVIIACGGLLGIWFGSSQSMISQAFFLISLSIITFVFIRFGKIWPIFFMLSSIMYFFVTFSEQTQIVNSQQDFEKNFFSNNNFIGDDFIGEGVIEQRPEFFYDKTQMVLKNVFISSVQDKNDSWTELKAKTLLTVKGNFLKEKQNFMIGDRVRFMGYVSIPNEPQNEYQFDYKDYLQKQRILFTAHIKNSDQIKVIHREKKVFFSMVHDVEYIINTQIYERYTQKVSGFLLAFISGQKGFLEETLKKSFNQLGITHILVISGLHIAILWGAIFMFVRLFSFVFPMSLPIQTLSAAISIPMLFLYVAMSGFQTAAVRALIICICLLIGIITQRNTRPFHNLCISFVIITIFDPLSMFQTSFILSFGSIIITLIIMKCIALIDDRSWLSIEGKSLLYRYIISMTIVSIAMWPLNVFYFGYIPLLSILANILFLPILSFVILPFALIIILMQILFSTNMMVTYFDRFVEIILYVIERFSDSVEIYYISHRVFTSFMLVLSIMILFLYRLQIKKYIVFQCCILVLLCIPSLIETDTQISFHSVGQGDASTIITSKRTAIVIDGGGSSQSNFDPGKSILSPFLHGKGITDIELMIMSHSDFDHLHGLLSLADEFQVHELWLGAVNEQNSQEVEHLKSMVKAKQGKIFERLSLPLYKQIKDIHIYIIDKENTYNKMLSTNNRSLIALIQYKQNTFLFTGDIEKEREEYLKLFFSRYCLLLFGSCSVPYPITALKVAHHGSKTSSTNELLSTIQPKYSIISAGKNNRFHFPHLSVIDTLKTYSEQILQTDTQGQISFIDNDNNTFDVKNFNFSEKKMESRIWLK